MNITNKKRYQQWYKEALETIFNKMTIEQKEELYLKFDIPLGTSLNLIGRAIDDNFEFIPKEILIESAKMVGLNPSQIESLDFIRSNKYHLNIPNKQEVKSGIINDNVNSFTPKKILDNLNTVVIGQDRAKKKIATAIYYQLKSLQDKQKDISPLSKTNSPLLLVGNTGTGKTFVVQKATQFTNLNFVHIDASSLVPTGIIGYSTDDIVKEIIRTAKYDEELAKYSVVFFDECDKILDKENGKSIISQLLRFSEGADCIVSTSSSDSDQDLLDDIKYLSTKNMLIIFGGSFQNIIDKSVVGFTKEQLDKKLTYEDIESSGFSKELLGRIKQIIVLNNLTQDDYLNILTKSSESPLISYTQKVKDDKNKVIIEKEVLVKISKIAFSSNLGVRRINQILEELFEDIMFKSPEEPYQRFTISLEDLKKLDS
jgi:ATP-dependent Clp protease ATP-binding subunit ClpX